VKPSQPIVLPATEIAAPGLGRRPITLGALVRLAVGLVLVVALPFVVFVRSAVFLHAHRGYGGWIAVIAALGMAALTVTGYAAWMSHRLLGRLYLRAALLWVAVPLVAGYGGYSVLYLSRMNAKSEVVRQYFRSVHPVLRIAISTWLLADPDLVITDLRRTPEDYAAMGLPAAEASLHYPQHDGYVHALDLRTLGRPAWRNWATDGYFRVMGFRTRRHVGSADHLHVTLPAR